MDPSYAACEPNREPPSAPSPSKQPTQLSEHGRPATHRVVHSTLRRSYPDRSASADSAASEAIQPLCKSPQLRQSPANASCSRYQKVATKAKLKGFSLSSTGGEGRGEGAICVVPSLGS